MRIIVNEQPTELPDHATITDLISQLGLSAARVAVEVNRLLVRRADHSATVLKPGDAVEIVTLVGGG